jgi:2-oxoglutarate dehydrogenase E1 component
MSAGQRLAYAGRPASASPAVGYLEKHSAQLKELLNNAFGRIKGFTHTK